MKPEELVGLITASSTFVLRPLPLEIDHRPAWRMGLILLILLRSRSKKSSVLRLQLIDWILRDEGHKESIIRFLSTSRQDLLPPIPDSSFFIGLQFLATQGLVSPVFSKKGSVSYQLSPDGEGAATWLSEISDVFLEEKGFLNEYGMRITERASTAYYLFVSGVT